MRRTPSRKPLCRLWLTSGGPLFRKCAPYVSRQRPRETGTSWDVGGSALDAAAQLSQERTTERRRRRAAAVRRRGRRRRCPPASVCTGVKTRQTCMRLVMASLTHGTIPRLSGGLCPFKFTFDEEFRTFGAVFNVNLFGIFGFTGNQTHVCSKSKLEHFRSCHYTTGTL